MNQPEHISINPAEFITEEQIPRYAKECGLIIYALSFKTEQAEQLDLNGKILFEANYAHPCFPPDTPPLPAGKNNISPEKTVPAPEYGNTLENNTSETGSGEKKYVYISGKYWLYNQAVPAFRLFTETEPDTNGMWNIF